MNKINYNNLILSKVFLSSYFFIFFIILFLKDSAIFHLLNGHTINNIYYFTIFVGIIINLFIIVYLGVKHDKSLDLLLGILLSLLFTIPLLFSVKLMSPVFFMFLLMLLNAKFVNPNKFIKTDFCMRISLVLFIVFLMLIHVLPSNVSFRGEISRYSIGFSGPNALAVIILSLFLSYYLMTYKKNINIKSVIIIIIIYSFVFYLTNTRQFQILGIIFMLFYFLNKANVNKVILKVISNLLIYVSVLFSAVISIAFIYNPNINTPFFYWLNGISSNRLVLEYQALIDYPVRLMGYTSMPLLTLKSENIDNFFANDMIHCGILGFIIMIIIFIYLGHKSIKMGNIGTNNCFILIMLAFITISTDELYAPLIFIATLSSYINSNKGLKSINR